MQFKTTKSDDTLHIANAYLDGNLTKNLSRFLISSKFLKTERKIKKLTNYSSYSCLITAVLFQQ